MKKSWLTLEHKTLQFLPTVRLKNDKKQTSSKSLPKETTNK